MIKNRREFFAKSLLGAGLLASAEASRGQMSMPMNTNGNRKGEHNPIFAGQAFFAGRNTRHPGSSLENGQRSEGISSRC